MYSDYEATREFVELMMGSTFLDFRLTAERLDDMWTFKAGDLCLWKSLTLDRWIITRTTRHEGDNPYLTDLSSFDGNSFLTAFKLFSRLYCDYKISRIIEEEIQWT